MQPNYMKEDFLKQLFGTVQTEHGSYEAMFCRDFDTANEATIHWFGRDRPRPGAATFNLRFHSDNKITGQMVTLWTEGEGGGLIYANQNEWNEARGLTISLQLSEDGFSGTWHVPNSNIQPGTIRFFGKPLPKSRNEKVTACDSWEEFRKWAARLQKSAISPIFRGHGSSQWALETTSFRAGQTRLERFYEDTLVPFKGHTEAIFDRSFDLTNGADYSTLLGLAQHHGLPTPLLDFSDSPYIAAYFAFADALDSDRDISEYVRVYALSGDFVRRNSPPTVRLATTFPYVCALSVSARHNPRLYAQQGRFLVTNVGNLEPWLLAQHAGDGPVLQAADIPVACAADALADLRYMGLTAATLFPGLDGACRMMRQNYRIKARSNNLSSSEVQGGEMEVQPLLGRR